MKLLPALLVASVLVAGAATVGIRASGYFADPSAALRELRALKVTPGPAAVFHAAQANDSTLLTLLARAGTHLDPQDPEGHTPLLHAARHRHWNLVKTLLAHPSVGPNPTSHARQSLLQLLLENDQLDLTRIALQKGAHPDTLLSTGKPALLEAIRAGQTDAVHLLLQHQANPNLGSSSGVTPLYLALRSRQPHLLPLLLQAQADPQTLTPNGQPLLAFLCQHHQSCGYTPEETLQLLELLLDAGADPHARDAQGHSPLYHALTQDFTAAVDLLLPRLQDVSHSLWIPLGRGEIPLVERLLQHGADPNEPRSDGERPLTHSIHSQNPALLHSLLNHGADPSLPGKEGQAALPLAIVLGHHRTTLTLLGHPKAPDPNRTLFHPVDPAFLKLTSSHLLHFYLNNAQDITPLMCAVCLDQEAVTLQLLKSGADRYAATSPKKVRAIQLAARRQNVPLQQILLGVPHEDHQQERRFVINLARQEVTYLKHGETVKTAAISSGRKSHPTIPGEYVITDKEPMHHSNLYDDAEMPFFQRFSCTAMGFHQGALPGYAASHGCVRLGKETASFLYEESQIGDRVTILEK